MNPWFNIAAVAIPEIAALVKAVLALKKKYPALTPDQINAVVANVTLTGDAAFNDALAKIAADQAAHPTA